MSFEYSKGHLTKETRRLQRFFETLPGLFSWSVLIGMFFLCVFEPIAASIIAIAFVFFWFLRLIYMTFFLVVSFVKLNAEYKTNWLKKTADFSSKRTDLPDLERIYHLVILPVAKEPESVLRPSIAALAAQSFTHKRMMVILAVEEHAPTLTKSAAENLVKEYQNTFDHFQVVIHPSGIPGEARVKGANATFAAKYAADLLSKKGIAPEEVIVSCFDADTVVDPQYFACVNYYYLTTPDRTRASYQPIPVYNNNIWNVPSFSRVMEIGSSFFQLIEATNPEKLVTFSSHSMSFKALIEIGYWPCDMISDDSAIFWKAYLFYKGQYRVVPMYITVSMDATVASSWWQTVKNIYKQRRRWAYGVENFPILMRGFLVTPEISLRHKLRHAFKMLEGHVSWATWGFLLTTLGWLIAVFADKQFHASIIYYNQPHVTGTLFRLSMISLAITIFVSLLLLPKAASRFDWLHKLRHAIEWLFMPLALVFLSALPALDAQTRLMFGRYMEFWVTDKSR
jgi:cellulose synthase/poly-beta-1,6-N-acetylglucosamine synthase-like glycosyltransferase